MNDPLLSFVPDLCPSMVILPRLIEQVNKKKMVGGKLVGRYDWLIERCKLGYYNEHKFARLPDTPYKDVKVELFKIFSRHRPLEFLIDPLQLGYFDDKPDEDDNKRTTEVMKTAPMDMMDLRLNLGIQWKKLR